MSNPRQTTIGKLRARTFEDPMVYRRRIEHDLLHADVHPSWLPDEAILYVRYVRLMSRGSLSSSLRENLEALRFLAVRPGQQQVVSHADAVLFSDEAERIASFTEDWLAGVGPSHWWWRQSLSAMERSKGALLWMASPCYAPAALSLLSKKGIAAQFAARINSVERKALLDVVAAAFHLALDLPGFGGDPETTPHSSLDTSIPEAVAFTQTRPGDLEQCILIRVLLTLARSPAVARSAAFREKIEKLWREMSHSVTIAPIKASSPATGTSEDLVSPLPVVAETPSSHPPSLTVDAMNSEPEHLLQTSLGGIFYLINLAIYLGRYQDFTSPSAAHEDPSIWKFVEWLARAMAPSQKGPPDPVWELLQELAGDDDRAIPEEWNLSEIALRLSEALGIPEREVAGFVLLRDARVRITLTHVSVFYLLSELQVNIRRSGLDRDPGWVPSAGRFIRFYYE